MIWSRLEHYPFRHRISDRNYCSKAIFFVSDRTGQFSLYRQSLDSTVAELISVGPESVTMVRVSPDDAFLIYSVYSKGQGPKGSSSVQLMRTSLATRQMTAEGGAHKGGRSALWRKRQAIGGLLPEAESGPEPLAAGPRWRPARLRPARLGVLLAALGLDAGG